MFQFLRSKLWLGSLLLAVGVVIAFAFPILYSAWLCDDSFITLRCIKQWLSGNGIGFNPNERVMAFTHPLWFFILSVAVGITGELYQTTILISIALSLIGITALAWAGHRSKKSMLSLGCLFLLSFSKAFIDYGTSGLENPLAYALLGALFLLLLLPKIRYGPIGICIALLVLTRMDYALLILPLTVFLLWKGGRQHLRAWVWGLGLILVWLAFSMVYFGSPFPNTFYAKLGSTAATSALFEKGANYYYVQSIYDPVTLILIAVGVVSGVLSRNGMMRCLSIGLFLYGLYIYRIGGDFMMGRFFSVSAFVGVFIMMRTLTLAPLKWSLGVCCLLFMWVWISVSSSHSHNPWGDLGTDYNAKPFVRDIGDTRGSYYQKYGFYSPNRKWPKVGDFSPRARVNKSPLIFCQGLGAFGLRAGNARYIIDQCALSDVFLARLPMKPNANFRIGHLERPVIADYVRSRAKDQNLFQDERLGLLFHDLSIITSQPLFSEERMRSIVRVNGGLPSYGLKTADLLKLKDRIESRNLINSHFPGEGI